MTTFRARHSRPPALFATVVATLSVALLHLCICIPLCPIQSISNQSCPSTEEHLLPPSWSSCFCRADFRTKWRDLSLRSAMDGWLWGRWQGRKEQTLSDETKRAECVLGFAQKVDVTGKTPFRSRMSLQIFFAIRFPKKLQINPNAIMRGQKSRGINEATSLDSRRYYYSRAVGRARSGPCRAESRRV